MYPIYGLTFMPNLRWFEHFLQIWWDQTCKNKSAYSVQDPWSTVHYLPPHPHPPMVFSVPQKNKSVLEGKKVGKKRRKRRKRRRRRKSPSEDPWFHLQGPWVKNTHIWSSVPTGGVWSNPNLLNRFSKVTEINCPNSKTKCPSVD